MIRFLWVLLSFVPLLGQAQFTYSLETAIPAVDLQGNDLPLAWAGGLNATNVNTVDLDLDGHDDLVLYDRMAGKVITFLSVDGRYVSAPDYENFFPTDISNWLLLRDYNCDGRKDLFTGDLFGIKVSTNITPQGGPPQWRPYLFSTGHPGSKSTALQTEGSTSKVNLQLQADDVPSISDVDGDGDLDIFNIQYAGHTIEFHQNLSIESGLPCDSLEFRRITRSWGNFTECECGDFAFNGEDCPPEAGGRTKHAGGKSLLTLDLNNDGQQDLIFSEARCTQMYALLNKGTTQNPIIDSYSAFPQPQPANMVIFPTPYYEDVDFDGKRDLIVTPNIFSKVYLNTFLDESIWFYKNTGTNSQPSFSFVQRDFLQRDMIDVGDNAIPAFIDFDGDDDFDMLVSSHASEEYTSRVYLYENTGSPSSPSFKLVDDDFLGFSQTTFYNLKIQFADMNGDHTRDLVFTATSFDNGFTRLYYFANRSETKMDFSEVPLRLIDFELTSSENIYVTELDGNGLPDLLVGRSEGNLEYWKNVGERGWPAFQLEERNYLGFSSTPLRQDLACVAADFDGDGTTDLAIGDGSGKLGLITAFQSGLAKDSDLQQNILYNPLLDTYTDKNFGGKIRPTAVNLFNTDKPALVVGNALGGVHILKNIAATSLSELPQLNVYPNPVGKFDILKVQADRPGAMQVISLLGQQLSASITLQADEVYHYSLAPLASGIYLLKFTANRKSVVQRFVVR
jgi:hypothetical protein